MAGSSLFALLDDIATLLDDVATMTKVATEKTAGVLGDDLALNAEQVSGVKVDRELPVVWAVCKGSAVNKVILVPAALALSTFLPRFITPLLMIGGAYLCFEGAEKIVHALFHKKEHKAKQKEALKGAILDDNVDMLAFEKQKIRGAIKTDFVLSAEIVVISLSAVADAELPVKIGVLSAVAALITIGVYGLVALIVKLDDMGLWLLSKGFVARVVGRALLIGAPLLMKALGVIGTVAMFLVGGGILAHAIPGLSVHGWLGTVVNAAVGLAAGLVLVGVTAMAGLVRRRWAGPAAA